ESADHACGTARGDRADAAGRLRDRRGGVRRGRLMRGGTGGRRRDGEGHLGAGGAGPRKPRGVDRAGARDHLADHQTQQRDRRCPVSGILDGKVALVTGAGTGLGRGIAQALAEAGADVAVAEIDGESAEVAARELAETGVRAKAYETDVSKSD